MVINFKFSIFAHFGACIIDLNFFSRCNRNIELIFWRNATGGTVDAYFPFPLLITDDNRYFYSSLDSLQESAEEMILG